MKRVTQDPFAAVESMLDSCRNDEVNFFFIDCPKGKSICIYPTSDDSFAARNAVQIIAGAGQPFFQAGLIGLIHLHNRRYFEATSVAVENFIAACRSDFYFGSGDGE